MPYSKYEKGRHFPSVMQRNQFDRAHEEDHGLTDKGKSDFDNAPTDDPIQEGAKHGIVMEHSYKIAGNGRHEISIKYADGYEHRSVHPEAFRAHEMLTKAHGFDESPPVIKTHMRSRAHPVGEKESDRLAREDHRDVPEEHGEGGGDND